MPAPMPVMGAERHASGKDRRTYQAYIIVSLAFLGSAGIAAAGLKPVIFTTVASPIAVHIRGMPPRQAPC
eukprot:5685751-Pyramimonas_sp.AAC.1